MLELDNYPKYIFEKLGITPEQARDHAIEVLESINIEKEYLDSFMRPIEEIQSTTWELIADFNAREDEVRSLAASCEEAGEKIYGGLLDMRFLD